MSTGMETELAQLILQFALRQWSWNLLAIGIGFFMIIMTRRILLGGAKMSLITGAAIILVSSIGVVVPSGEYIFNLLGNLGVRVAMPDGLTTMAFGVVGGVGGTFYLRAPVIEKIK